MFELFALALMEAVFLIALHSQIQNYFGTRRREKLKARLRGCL